MAYIKKRVGARKTTYRASVFLRGVRDTQTFESKAAAQAWATRREAEILAGSRGEAPKKKLRQALDRYRDEVSPTRKGSRWERVRLDKLARDMDCADLPLSALSAQHIASWRDTRLTEVKPGSVRREMALLASVLEYCKREWRWLSVNPIRDVTKPPSPPPRDKTISQTQQGAILAALAYQRGSVPSRGRHFVAVGFLLALETAMRAGEVFGLTWDRVFLDKRYVLLEATKNGDKREVPLSTKAIELIKLLPGTEGR